VTDRAAAFDFDNRILPQSTKVDTAFIADTCEERSQAVIIFLTVNFEGVMMALRTLQADP